jgi:PII-like signaling protein
MKTRATARRVMIFVDENDTWHHRPLYTEIVHRAHAAGLSGATVFRAIEGFGASSTVHTSRLLSLSQQLPVAVVVIDDAEAIEAFLPTLDELITEGLVTIDDVAVLRYRAARRDAPT